MTTGKSDGKSNGDGEKEGQTDWEKKLFSQTLHSVRRLQQPNIRRTTRSNQSSGNSPRIRRATELRFCLFGVINRARLGWLTENVRSSLRCQLDVLAWGNAVRDAHDPRKAMS